MNTDVVVFEQQCLEELLTLVRMCQPLATKQRERRRLLALLASIEARVAGMKKRFLVASLTEQLWDLLDHVDGTETGDRVRDLVVRINTEGLD